MSLSQVVVPSAERQFWRAATSGRPSRAYRGEDVSRC